RSSPPHNPGVHHPGKTLRNRPNPIPLSTPTRPSPAVPSPTGSHRAMRRAVSVAKAAIIAFYHDQGTHHAGALTYYALMSLFPLVLLAVSLLGLLGEYPGTYNSIIHHLRPVVPAKVLTPINDALRTAFESRRTALVAF